MTTAVVASPPADLTDILDQDSDWFHAEIYCNTGDGHACGSRDDAGYDVYVENSDDRPDLIGVHWEIG